MNDRYTIGTTALDVSRNPRKRRRCEKGLEKLEGKYGEIGNSGVRS